LIENDECVTSCSEGYISNDKIKCESSLSKTLDILRLPIKISQNDKDTAAYANSGEGK
jgi:hypothetical protein